ncbi:hypothetical protein MMC32_004605 [Xylographa parallela]|nr:hypothetical protein [Xylographa parallela]
MPSLLDIPPELRLQIIDLVLCHRRTPPQDPDTASLKRVPLHDVQYVSQIYGPEHTLYDLDGYTTNSLSLLLTSRHLWAETQSALQALSAEPSYSLDVMFVNERELWPTWVSVPALWTRLDSVVATFRICYDETWKKVSGLDGAPDIVVWCFCSLLERFLTYGPVGQRRLGCQDRNITVQSITLDFVSAPGVEATMHQGGPFSSDWYGSRSRASWFDWTLPIILQAGWFVELLHRYISTALSMSDQTARWGMILYERIGTLRLGADGEVTKEYDLGKMLAAAQYNDASELFGDIKPREDRVLLFREWKRKTVVKRREAGLPVMDAEDSELVGS